MGRCSIHSNGQPNIATCRYPAEATLIRLSYYGGGVWKHVGKHVLRIYAACKMLLVALCVKPPNTFFCICWALASLQWFQFLVSQSWCQACMTCFIIRVFKGDKTEFTLSNAWHVIKIQLHWLSTRTIIYNSHLCNVTTNPARHPKSRIT